MAFYAALASLLELLDDILYRYQYPHFLLRRRQIMESLHNKFSLLQASLQDHSSKGDEATEQVERRIRDAAYQALDIIDSEISEQIHSQIPAETNDYSLQQVGREVDALLEEVKAIKKSQAPPDLLLDNVADDIGASEQTPAVAGHTMEGFEQYSNAIKAQLCGGSSQLQVISIVGMGGIGKTTLARKTFNDPLIQDKFDFRGWVTITQDYDVIKVLQNIIISLGVMTMDGLRRCVQEELDKYYEAIFQKKMEELKTRREEVEKREREKHRQRDEKKEEKEENRERVENRKEEIEDHGERAQNMKEKIEEHSERGKKKGEEIKEHRERESGENVKEEIEEHREREEHKEEEIEEHREREEHKEEEIEEHRESGENMREESDKSREIEERTLKIHIHKYLIGRRYLIAIDDVWSVKVWDYLKKIFPDDHKSGSRILLTTRLTDVAKYTSSLDFLHELKFLPDEVSWDLLRKKVFPEGDCPHELVDTGKLIASKCQGLPLAVVVIAGILSNVQTLGYWRMIEMNVGPVLIKDDNNLSNILSLSYNHLPHRLKTCFLHMGSFPEDYEINIFKLIRLWIAEGFLKSTNTSKSLEEVGEEYIEELVKRNLVIITKTRANGQFKFCVMHDLLRDFCRQRGLYECFFHDEDRVEITNPSGAEKVRRIILGSAPPSMSWANIKGKFVRSVCWFSKKTSSNIQRLGLDKIKLLRILDVGDAECSVAPFAFSQMFHLKYLALRLGSKKKRHLPPSISMFQNLRTLIIYAPSCESISLPSEIWKVSQLRHLIIDRMILLQPVAMIGDSPLQKLEHLQTLETVKEFVFTDNATRMIPNIRKLKLSCERVEASGTWNQYCLQNLVSLLQLEKLNIVFYGEQFSYTDPFQNSVVFPEGLKELSLEGCQFSWSELTVAGFLPCLQVLRLRKDAVVGEEWETIEGQFLKLKFLLMESLDLKQWKADCDHFPCLEHLRINKCNELEEIPLEIGYIPTLKFIDVRSCKHAGNSASEIVNDQQYMGNDVLQVLIRD